VNPNRLAGSFSREAGKVIDVSDVSANVFEHTLVRLEPAANVMLVMFLAWVNDKRSNSVADAVIVIALALSSQLKRVAMGIVSRSNGLLSLHFSDSFIDQSVSRNPAKVKSGFAPKPERLGNGQVKAKYVIQ
jgi:hypothetical protein